jgi:hypothetical protein
MSGHTVEFQVVFRSEGEVTRSRIEATLEYPQKDGSRGVVSSTAMIAVGRVNFSFVFEDFGELHLVLSKDGGTFFEETIPIQPYLRRCSALVVRLDLWSDHQAHDEVMVS